MRPTVYLWDIDGTLITSGGAGRRAIDRAFDGLHGRADACDGISFGGMTDRAIARQGLGAIGVDATDAAIDALLGAYLAALDEEVLRAADYRLHAGITTAVDACLGRGAAAVGLGTGNVEAGARIKLARVGLDRTFPFGGFGSDHEERGALLRVGAERGAARLGLPRGECRVVVIGDTPRDVEAARAIGAEVIAVATGPFSTAQLAATAPDRVVADLSASGAIAWLIAG